MTAGWHEARAALEEADAMLALLARMNGPGTTPWLLAESAATWHHGAVPGPEARALGGFPARCGTCGRPAGHTSVPCAACPDVARLISELAARHRSRIARANVPATRVSPPPDPAREIERDLALPLGASLADLRAAVPDQPPGYCRECRAVPSASGSRLCAWCADLAALQAKEKTRLRAARPRDRSGWAGLILLGTVLLLAGVHLGAWLAIPGAILLTAGIWRGRSS